jgi:chromatin segregation and condensation protein Rec8/ScpA/Scc1 (kleisin family)
MAGEWNPPVLDEPASSPARRSFSMGSHRADASEINETGEERLDGETTEAYEERTRLKHVQEVSSLLKAALVGGTESTSFSKIVAKCQRKAAAQKFYSLLVLKKAHIVDVDQESGNGEIKITRGPHFETAVF